MSAVRSPSRAFGFASRLGLLAAALAGTFAVGTAAAQTPGPPVRLGPGDAASQARPLPLLSGAGRSMDGVGVLTAADGGLGSALWSGSSFALVQRLLAELPVSAPSPVQRALTLRLLLSAADPPSGDESGRALMPVRVAKLAAMGADSDLERLLAAMSDAGAELAFARRLGAAKAETGATDGAADLVGKAPADLAALARSEGAFGDVRVIAAERAAAAGALSPTELASAYASVQLAPAALAHPLSAGETGARARALVYQVTLGETQPVVAAELVGHWLALLEPTQAVGPVAAVPLAALARLPAEAVTAWLAPQAGRALLTAGQAEAAAVWLRLPHASADAAAILRLWPLGVLAGAGADGGVGGGLDAWLAAALAGADAARRERVAAVLTVLQAAGERVGDDAWAQTAGQGAGGGGGSGAALPSPALWQSLDSATAGHRLGEVVLVALTSLGEGGPQAVPPLVLARVLASLREVGLVVEARGLAREAVAALLE